MTRLYKLGRMFRTHRVLDGLANMVIFTGILCCVAGGFFFAVVPWITWAGLALFIGGLVLLGYSEEYLPSELERKRDAASNDRNV